MGIEIVFTRSIIEYGIHRKTVCRLNTSLSRDNNQGLDMSREDSYSYDPMQKRLVILVFTSGRRLDSKAPLIDNSTDTTTVLLIQELAQFGVDYKG